MTCYFADDEFCKSAYSGDGNCVEVAQRADIVGLRDSKDRTGPVLRFTGAEWQAFILGARAGQFD